MPLVNRVRPRIGDVVEIQTKKGLAYAQFTHSHKRYGALLRVFGEFFARRPNDFTRLVTQPSLFEAFFPLGSACAQNIVAIVANESIALPREFPMFRTGIENMKGVVECWWLWDGETEQRIGELKQGMERYPIRGVINDTLLIERIEDGWRAERIR
jgi:hypothetical protein